MKGEDTSFSGNMGPCSIEFDGVKIECGEIIYDIDFNTILEENPENIKDKTVLGFEPIEIKCSLREINTTALNPIIKAAGGKMQTWRCEKCGVYNSESQCRCGNNQGEI